LVPHPTTTVYLFDHPGLPVPVVLGHAVTIASCAGAADYLIICIVYAVGLAGGRLMATAGLWETCRSP
jgi:hypothetical protein